MGSDEFNFIATVGKSLRHIKVSASNVEEAKKEVEKQLEWGEEIFNLTQSTGTVESGS